MYSGLKVGKCDDNLASVIVLTLAMERALPSILNQSLPSRSLTVQSSPEKEKNFSLSLRLVSSGLTYFWQSGSTLSPEGWPANSKLLIYSLLTMTAKYFTGMCLSFIMVSSPTTGSSSNFEPVQPIFYDLEGGGSRQRLVSTVLCIKCITKC